MASKDRKQRRAKRLARQKKKRANASRPARFGPTAAGSVSLKAALNWPPGDCYVTDGWDAPGASLHAVFARSHEDGRTAAAFVEIDRSGPGIVSARVDSYPVADGVLGECIRLSEQADDLAFRGVPPGVVAGVMLDAEEHGAAAVPAAWAKVKSMIDGVDPAEVDAAFGPAPEVEERSGLLDRFFKFLG